MRGTATVKFRIAVDVEVNLPIDTETVSLNHLQNLALLDMRASFAALEKASLHKNVRLAPDPGWEDVVQMRSVHIDSTVFLRNRSLTDMNGPELTAALELPYCKSCVHDQGEVEYHGECSLDYSPAEAAERCSCKGYQQDMDRVVPLQHKLKRKAQEGK